MENFQDIFLFMSNCHSVCMLGLHKQRYSNSLSMLLLLLCRYMCSTSSSSSSIRKDVYQLYHHHNVCVCVCACCVASLKNKWTKFLPSRHRHRRPSRCCTILEMLLVFESEFGKKKKKQQQNIQSGHSSINWMLDGYDDEENGKSTKMGVAKFASYPLPHYSHQFNSQFNSLNNERSERDRF